MKKTLAIALAIVLLLVVAIVPTEIQFNLTDKNLAASEVKEFDGSDLVGLSIEEKVDALGLSPEMKSVLIRQLSERISTAERISTSTAYYIQDGDSCVLSTSDGNRKEMNGGELKIVIVTLIEGDDYICAGIFQWLTMPKGRHTDGFHIANHHDIPIHGDSASGYCEYKVNTEYLNGIKLVGEEKTIGEDIPADDIMHISDNGFCCSFNLKDDVKQFGYPFMRVKYTDFTGILCFSGKFPVGHKPEGINQVARYSHQKYRSPISTVSGKTKMQGYFSMYPKWAYEDMWEENLLELNLSESR